MSSKLVDLLDPKVHAFTLNFNENMRIRHGWTRTYAPTGLTNSECVGMCATKYAASWPTGAVDTEAIVSVWSDGTVHINGGASVGTVYAGNYRWVQLIPMSIFAYDATGWFEKNIVVILTDGNHASATNYILDFVKPDGVNYLYPATMTAATVPTAGVPAGGVIPAGTYRYGVTEIDYWGNESPISTALSVTSATDFQVVITKGATVNTTVALRWRLYRSLESDAAGQETWGYVNEAPLATTTLTDNTAPYALGTAYDPLRIALPKYANFGCMHLGVPAYSGSIFEPTSVYFADVSVARSGVTRSGYPEPGYVKFTRNVPDSVQITALASISNLLLVFSKNKIFALHDKPWDASAYWRTVSEDVGTLNFRTVTAHGGKIYFFDGKCENAYVTDGYEVKKVNDDHLFQDIWYYLSGVQGIEYKGITQGGWTAQQVFSDPEHRCVYFGGEICSDTYRNTTDIERGTWSTAARDANPQGNRQYVWKVYWPDTGTWRTYTNILAKATCVQNGRVVFADHFGYVNTFAETESSDGVVTATLIDPTLTPAAASTTITWADTWSGTGVVRTPVSVVNNNGSTKLVYNVSNNTTSMVVDKAIDTTANDRLMWGAIPCEVWLEGDLLLSRINEIELICEATLQRGYAPVLGLYRPNVSIGGGWLALIDVFPMSNTVEKYYIGQQGWNSQMRFVFGSATGTTVPLTTPVSVVVRAINLNGQRLRDNRW